jgi:quinol monooxygenase YgiN
MVVLEAHVAPDQWAKLREAFQADVAHMPLQMMHAFLVQSATDPTLWRGVSIWDSSEALQEYRSSVQLPAGISLFRAVGVELQVNIYEIVSERHQ